MSKKVLVIDDDELVRQGLAGALSEKGLTVEEAADGKAGLDKVLSGDFDLVVTDVRMPEMDGLEMVEKIRKSDAAKNVPVIIMTVDENTETLNQALQSGVTVYLSKSTFDTEAIADQIVAAAG